MKNHYKVLNVSENASQAEIKAAYRVMAMHHHPDRNQGSAESHERFIVIEQAYSTLSDPRMRAAFDDELYEHRARRAEEERRRNAPKHVAPVQRQVTQPEDTGPNWVGLGLFALAGIGLAAAASNTKDANGRFHGRDGKFRSGRWG